MRLIKTVTLIVAVGVVATGCVVLPQGEAERLASAVQDADFASVGTVLCEASGGPELISLTPTTETWWHNVYIEDAASEPAVIAQLEAAGFEQRDGNSRILIDHDREVGAIIEVVAAGGDEKYSNQCAPIPESGEVIVVFGA